MSESALEARVTILEHEIHGLREWRHTIANDLPKIIAGQVETFARAHAKPNGAVHVKPDTDALSWTWGSRIIGAAVAGAAFAIWMLHLMGKV